MAKYWEPGRVKTRLGAAIGMETAARLHHLFCSHLATELKSAANECVFVITPENNRRQFSDVLGSDWSIEIQSEGDLGDRMQTWFKSRLSVGGQTTEPHPNHANVILIGADCPTIDVGLVGTAIEMLETAELVLGPAIDGGYYLIGFAGPWREAYGEVFREMPWSSETLFETTCARATEAGLGIATLPEKEDVDTANELDRLREELSRNPDPANHRLLDHINGILDGKQAL